MRNQVIDMNEERFWRDLEALIFDQERLDRAPDECAVVLRTLGIEQPAHILDVGCGPGRHSHQFALLGHHVEGIDTITYLVKKARLQAPKGQYAPIFHVGDIGRFSSYQAPWFDCAVSLYHSFGYSGDAGDDARILDRLHNLLRPGGKLFLELIDPDGFSSGLTLDFETLVGNELFHERIQISPNREKYELIVQKQTTVSQIYRASHRLFSRKRISELLADAGFVITWPDANMLITYPGGSRKFCVIGERR